LKLVKFQLIPHIHYKLHEYEVVDDHHYKYLF